MAKIILSYINVLKPVIILFIGWEISSRYFFPEQSLFPPASQVFKTFYLLAREGFLFDHIKASFLRVAAGFFLGACTGLVLGIAMGWNEAIRNNISPIISILYPIPAIGWLPLFILWIGINELLPVMIVFICAFFPMLYNTMTGVKSVDQNLVKASKMLGASEWQVLTTIVLPLALPNIFTGLKLEAGMAWRVIIAAEMIAISTGLGSLLMKGESLLRVDIIIVCLLILSLLCFCSEKIFLLLENKLTSKWRDLDA